MSSYNFYNKETKIPEWLMAILLTPIVLPLAYFGYMRDIYGIYYNFFEITGMSFIYYVGLYAFYRIVIFPFYYFIVDLREIVRQHRKMEESY